MSKRPVTPVNDKQNRSEDGRRKAIEAHKRMLARQEAFRKLNPLNL